MTAEELRAAIQAVQQVVQVLVFLGVALASVRVWTIQRSRPAAWLVVAFATLGAALVVNRVWPADGAGADLPLVRDLVLFGIGSFPWLLAMFAWSFEPRFPRWLLASGGAVLALGVWSLMLPTSAMSGTTRPPMGDAFVAAFILVWVLLSAAAATRLWRAGGTQVLVRARMRWMAVGALLLAAALLLVGSGPPGEITWMSVAASAMSSVAAVLFLGGFAPPRALRVWWRRRATPQWQRMQLDLIAASTPQQAARAVVPVVAELIGGGVVVVAPDGELLAYARLDPGSAEEVAARIAAGQSPQPGDEIVPVDRASMVVRPTAYTPLFQQDGRDLMVGFATQLRLALERAQLYVDMEQARADVQRARDEEQAMIMGLAHDLRGSSNTLGGYTSLLRSSEDDGEREEILGGIEASSAHLEALVGSLLELGRVGIARSRTDPVDLDDVVDEVIARYEPVYPWVTFRRGKLPAVAGDRLELAQAFENLFVNAAKHGGSPDLVITLTSERNDETVTIDVCDDGRGIDPADRPSVFRMFHRGRSSGGSGSGVGLNLVRRIVEAHDGTIELLDNRPGAHFRLCFPVVAQDDPLAAPRSAADAEPLAGVPGAAAPGPSGTPV